MMRRRSAMAAAVFAVLSCGAVELVELPEVLATLNGVPIRRDELAAVLTPRLAGMEGGPRETAVRKEVRRAVDDEICRRLLDDMLKKAALKPSRELALEYLAVMLADVPILRRRELERELLPQADSPEFQLKAAVHIYLLRRFERGILKVTDREIERYYQLNQLRYRLPERWDVGVIRIDRKRNSAADLAEEARARLLQGEAFERVAKEIDPDGGGERLSPEELRRLFADELSRLSPGDVSRAVSTADAFFVLLLRGRELGGAIPLEEVSGCIRLELSAVKDTLALRKLIVERIAESVIVYAESLRSE